MTEPMVLATGRGAVLFDANCSDEVPERWFDRDYWISNDAVIDEASGRGTVLVVRRGSQTWVLRHYRRGGLVARFIEDHYVWLGLERTRAFREWRLLSTLCGMNLPVPRPVAARVIRTGWAYQADIITAYLADARALAAHLADGPLPVGQWAEIGRVIRRFHDHGVDHPDLTTHNILLDSAGTVYLVDFDKARFRAPGRWRAAGIARLQRSLRKLALESGAQFADAGWEALTAAYGHRDPVEAD